MLVDIVAKKYIGGYSSKETSKVLLPAVEQGGSCESWQVAVVGTFVDEANPKGEVLLVGGMQGYA